MYKPVARLAAPARNNLTAARQIHSRPTVPLRRLPKQQPLQVRRYADAGGASNNNQTLIILGALALLGAGGYYMLKPVSDTAQAAKQGIESVKSGVSSSSDTLGALAKGSLPASAFAMYNQLANQEGGLNGFLSSLKDKDLQGVIDEVKKVGNDDVKRVIDKVEKKVMDAKGNVQNVDWKGLAQELKQELPKDKQHMVDMLIGYLPGKEDVQEMINKIKSASKDQLKQLEETSSKVWAEVEKAKKEGKGQADAFLKGLKSATPEDVDTLIKQLKDAAKSAGLPADQIESWLKRKADEKEIDAEQLGKQLEDKLKTAQKFMPTEPKELVKQVEQISPSVAKLLQQAMEQAGIMKQ